MGGAVLTKAELLQRIEELEERVVELEKHREFHYHFHPAQYPTYPYWNTTISNNTDLWNRVIGSQTQG